MERIVLKYKVFIIMLVGLIPTFSFATEDASSKQSQFKDSNYQQLALIRKQLFINQRLLRRNHYVPKKRPRNKKQEVSAQSGQQQ